MRAFFLPVMASGLLLVCCTAKEDLGSSGNSRITTLASNQNQPASIELDEKNVYWLNQSPVGGLYEIAKSGGQALPLAEGDFARAASSIAVDATSAYLSKGNAIFSVPLASDGSYEQLTTFDVVIESASFALAGRYLYWTEGASAIYTSNDASVAAYPKSVARRIPVTGGLQVPIAFPSAVDPSATVSSIATGDDGIYVSFSTGIARLPFGAPDSAITFLPADRPLAMAFDSTNIYFMKQEGAVAVMPKVGGQAINLGAAPTPGGVAVDDEYVYFTDAGPSGRVLKVAKSGGTVTVIADNQGGPLAIAVDATSVYWTCTDEGTIKKASK